MFYSQRHVNKVLTWFSPWLNKTIPAVFNPSQDTCKTAHRFMFWGQLCFAIEEVFLVFPSATNHWLTDAVFPCNLKLFSMASAVATILSLNTRLFDVQQAFGMVTDWLWMTVNPGLLKTGLWTQNVHMIKLWIQFYSFNWITLNSAKVTVICCYS